MSSKLKILVLIDWFDPAYKAGGPITSCVNFVKLFSDKFELRVLTSAFDLDGKEIVDESMQSAWMDYNGHAKVYYAGRSKMNYRSFAGLIKQFNPDYLYCNSMFSLKFSIYPLLGKLTGNIQPRIVLAPRGMLKDSALAFKALKKTIFLSVFKISGIPKKIIFHATDEAEKGDLVKHFGAVNVAVAGNIPAAIGSRPVIATKIPGKLNVLFLGRIHPIKQLDYLLQVLQEIPDRLNLTVIGPMEDQAYWKQCLSMIENLPGNITVDYVGEKAPSVVHQIFDDQHIMVLPTKGENFGHAIFESFAHGKPVVISNRTPWLNLEEEMTGYALDLGRPGDFVTAITHFAGMDQKEYNEWSAKAFVKAERFMQESGLVSKYEQLFDWHEN